VKEKALIAAATANKDSFWRLNLIMFISPGCYIKQYFAWQSQYFLRKLWPMQAKVTRKISCGKKTAKPISYCHIA
jgi:hypothetical protein